MKTYDPQKNRSVHAGQIKGDTFVKNVTAKHYMRIFDGYGIQKTILENLQKKGINKILIKTSNNRQLETTVNNWIENGIERDLGHGRQIFLPIKYII